MEVNFLKKKEYQNKFTFSGKPAEVKKKLVDFSDMLTTIGADWTLVKVSIDLKGFKERKWTKWFTSRKLALIGIAVSVVVSITLFIVTWLT